MLRLLSTATLLSLGTAVFLALAVPRLSTGYSETVVRAELQAATPDDTLDTRALAAIEDGDIDGAVQYATLADELGKPVAPATRERLDDARGTLATFLRHAGDFAGAYVTGNADSAAALAGAIASDLTVVGDVRDIISEGGKAAIGEDYSRFLLGLAAIGLAAEGAIIATGGTSITVKVGVSVLKVARRTGNLTVAFGTRLMRLARAAARPAGRGVQVASAARVSDVALAPAGAVAGLGRTAARAELGRALGAVSRAADNAGPANTVRLMRTVRTTADAEELATFTGRFGRRSRAVAELTGKTTLRGFRAALRGMRLLVAFLWSLVAWVAGLIALRAARFVVRSLFDVLRGLFFTVAVR
ncbi:MAG: hypothetical protein AcusKO_11560 [Acuticoccus sp.]